MPEREIGSAEYRIVTREVWWPPGRPRRRLQGELLFCGRAEVGLARSGDIWVVLWKTPWMSAVAHTPYPCLREAWASFRRHREVLRALSREASPLDRVAELDRRITALQRERDLLAQRIEEGSA